MRLMPELNCSIDFANPFLSIHLVMKHFESAELFLKKRGSKEQCAEAASSRHTCPARSLCRDQPSLLNEQQGFFSYIPQLNLTLGT